MPLQAAPVLFKEIIPLHADIDNLPRENLLFAPFAGDVKSRIETGLAACGPQVLTLRKKRQDPGDAPVAPGEKRLQHRGAQRLEDDLGVGKAGDGRADAAHLLLQALLALHSRPLKRGGGLGDKGVDREGDGAQSPALFPLREPDGARAGDEFEHLVDIGLILARQPDEKIKLEVEYPPLAQQADRSQNLLLVEPLVDQVTHALAAGLGRQGHGAVSRLLQRLDLPFRQRIDAQARHRNLAAASENLLFERFQFAVIGDGGTDQADLVAMAQSLADILFQRLHGTFARRQVEITGGTEPASATASPGYLCKSHAGELGLLGGHKSSRRIPVDIRDPLTGHAGDDTFLRPAAGNGSVIVIIDVVKRRHVKAGPAGEPGEQLPAVRGCFKQFLDETAHNDLAFADGENVHHFGQRLGVEKGAHPAAQHQRKPLFAVDGEERHLSQVENGRQIQIVVLEGNGESDDIEFGEVAARFEGEERIAGLEVLIMILAVGQEEPLAKGIVAAVEQVVDAEKTEVAHRLVVGIGVDEGNGQTSSPGVRAASPFGIQAVAGFLDQFFRHDLFILRH